MLLGKNDKRLLFLLLILILIPIVMYVYLVLPAKEEASRLQAMHEQQRRLYVNTAHLAADRQADDAWQEAALAKLRSLIPERPYQDQILRDLRLLEVASGLQMSMYHINTEADAVPLPDDVGAHLNVITITTSVEGTYKQIERMLEELETMNRLYTVDQLTLSTDAGSLVELAAEDKVVTCLLTLHTYYAPSLQVVYPLPVETAYTAPGEKRAHIMN